MRAIEDRPNSALERERLKGPACRLKWDDLKLLLIAAECGSLRAAADLLGCSAATVSNRIEALERQTGRRLFDRSVRGLSPTGDGTALLEIAEKMRRASLETAARVRRSPAAVTGSVRGWVTEGLGTFWLVPRLVEFHRLNPGLTLHLHCEMRRPDLMRHEAQFAIQLDRPTAPDLIVQRIGYIHVMPFAAESYLRLRGVPRSIADMQRHRFVEQKSPQIPSEILYDVFPGAETPGFVSIRTNTSTANLWAISNGAGVGMLPTYARAITKRVRPLEMGIRLRRDIWLTWHPSVRRSRAVELTLRWIRDAFDARKYPWFGEQFIHPDELERKFHRTTVVKLFEGFLETAITGKQSRGHNT